MPIERKTPRRNTWPGLSAALLLDSRLNEPRTHVVIGSRCWCHAAKLDFLRAVAQSALGVHGIEVARSRRARLPSMVRLWQPSAIVGTAVAEPLAEGLGFERVIAL